MKPVKTPLSNHNFGPPLNVTDGSIGDLPCRWTDEHGFREVISVWEFSDGERAAIATGFNVELGIAWLGAFPPVSLNVTDERSVAQEADKDAPPPITAALRVGSDRAEEEFILQLDLQIEAVRDGMIAEYLRVHAPKAA